MKIMQLSLQPKQHATPNTPPILWPLFALTQKLRRFLFAGGALLPVAVGGLSRSRTA